jgi:hypothetical protein
MWNMSDEDVRERICDREKCDKINLLVFRFKVLGSWIIVL